MSAIHVHKTYLGERTIGQRIADGLASAMGSWPFLIIQSCILAMWVMANVLGWWFHWDPYPFILMNLVLSMQAAYAAPIIMMSQNRQDTKDRIRSEKDYQVDLHNEKMDEEILNRLKRLEEILNRLKKLEEILKGKDNDSTN